MIYADSSQGDRAIKATARGWIIWGTASLFYLYEFFVRVAPSAMEPELQTAFRLSAAGLGAAMGVYYFVYSPMQLLAGSFLDRLGARQVLVPAALICTIGCFIEPFGHDPLILSIARLFQGFGSAFAFVGTMYLAAEWFPRSMLALLSGLTTSLGMAGAIIGNAGIANVVSRFGWHTALFVAGGVGLVVTLLIAVLVPKDSKARKRRASAAEMPRGPGFFRALRTVWSNPQSWFAGIAGTALYMPLSVLGALWGESFIASITATDKVAASGAVSMLYVGWLVGGPIAGWYSDHRGVRRNMLLFAGIGTLLTTLTIALVPHLSLTGAYVLMFILGLTSCSEVICFVTAVEHNPAAVAGTALAATNMMIMLFGGMGEWGFGALLDYFGGSGNASDYPESTYRKAMLILPAFSAVGVVAAWFLKESYHRTEVVPGPEPIN